MVGTHRSGTTATAGALSLLGLQLGQKLDSHHESKALQQMHEQYLHRVGAAWHKPQSFLDAIAKPAGERECVDYLLGNDGNEFLKILSYRGNLRGWWLRSHLRAGAPWGWKEPRTTLFAPCWLRIFRQARIIDIVRHPVAVALSIRERELQFRAAGDHPITGLDQIDYCVDLALKYVRQGAALADLTHHYRRVRFEDLQEDPTDVLRDLGTFCGLSFTVAQLAEAARSIRPPEGSPWPRLNEEEQRQLAPLYPAIADLGYDVPANAT